VVFGGFSPDSLAGRIVDCDSRIVITADEGVRIACLTISGDNPRAVLIRGAGPILAVLLIGNRIFRVRVLARVREKNRFGPRSPPCLRSVLQADWLGFGPCL
jgi:hypothetical protein